MTLKLRLLPLAAAAFVLPRLLLAAIDAPLPEPDTHFTPEDSFPLLPPVDGLPPPDAPAEPVTPEDNVVLAPAAMQPDDLPAYDTLGAPSDGEAMPELPYAPGLVVPQFKKSLPTSPIPGLIPPAGSAPGDGLLPSPALELKADTSRAFWFPSPREARRVAIKERKPLLLFFAQRFDARDEQGNTGCPTIALNDDMFAVPGNEIAEAFNHFAGAKLVTTSLHYPARSLASSNLPEAKKQALQQFQDYFKVTGFPTLILIDENGKELERIKGYRRYKDANNQLYTPAHTYLDRLKEAVRRDDERKRYRQDRIDRLTAQGYRMWTNRGGYQILAKLVEYSRDRVVLMDENNKYRFIQPELLRLYDEEWARRKHAGEIHEESTGAAGATAAAP